MNHHVTLNILKELYENINLALNKMKNDLVIFMNDTSCSTAMLVDIDYQTGLVVKTRKSFRIIEQKQLSSLDIITFKLNEKYEKIFNFYNILKIIHNSNMLDVTYLNYVLNDKLIIALKSNNWFLLNEADYCKYRTNLV